MSQGITVKELLKTNKTGESKIRMSGLERGNESKSENELNNVNDMRFLGIQEEEKRVDQAQVNEGSSVANDSNEKDDEKEAKVLKTRKLKLFPSKRQGKKFRHSIDWFGAVRWTYNQCVFAHKKGILTGVPSRKELRNYCVSRSSPLFQQNEWLSETPQNIRDEAIIEFQRTLKSNFKALKEGPGRISKFDLKIKSKRRQPQHCQTIVVQKKYWNKNNMFPKFGMGTMKTTEKLPEELVAACKITMTRNGTMHIHIPVPLDVNFKERREDENKRALFIDPGIVRTFGTCYDLYGTLYEWGKNDISKMYDLCLQIDECVSDSMQNKKNEDGGFKHNDHRSWKRRHAKQKRFRLQAKLGNLRRDFHYRFAKHLCNNYDMIILPKFGVSDMVKKKTKTSKPKEGSDSKEDSKNVNPLDDPVRKSVKNLFRKLEKSTLKQRETC